MSSPPLEVKVPRKGLKWSLTLVVGIALAYGACFHPRFTTVTLRSGEHFDVIQVTRDPGVGRMFGDTVARMGEAVIVNYYAPALGYEEAQKVIPVAEPAATQFGDSLIIVQQTQTPYSRWIPVVRGQMFAFRRTPQGWVSAR